MPRWAAAGLAGLVLATAGASAGDRVESIAVGRIPRPAAIRMTDRGAKGRWAVGVPVTVEWRQRLLSGTDVRIELSRAGQRRWELLGTVPAEQRRFEWVAEGDVGTRARVRIRSADGEVVSKRRPVRFTSPVREISLARGWFGVALHDDGMVRTWGQYGTDPLRNLARSVVIPDLTDVVSISADGYHMVAIKADGSVWLFGDPDGPGNNDQLPIFVPRRLEGIENAVWARAWTNATYIGVADGRVFGMGGHGGRGVMDDEVGVPADVPVEIPELHGALDVGIGWSHAIALRPDGRVLSWGTNGGGQLGDDSVPKGRKRPGLVHGIDDVVSIACRIGSSMALRRDGTVWVWGDAQHLLQPVAASTSVPLRVPNIERIIAIGSQGSQGMALREDGIVFGWGVNIGGYLGPNTYTWGVDRPVILELPPIRRMFPGHGGAQFIATNGERLAVGDVTGDGTFEVRSRAVPVYSD